MRLVGALAATAALAAPAAAQDINDLNVDFFQGPINSSGRVIGLGGAYTGIAEGADGHLSNPASYATRYVYEADDTWAWDFAFSGLDDAGRNRQTFDLSGRGVYDSANFGQLGIDAKYKEYGFGIHSFGQIYTMTVDNEDGSQTTFEYDQNFVSLGFAHNFSQGELVLGASLLGGLATIAELNVVGKPIGALEMQGGGLQFGALWARPDKNYRLGASFRTPIIMTQQESDTFTGELVTEFGKLRVPNSVIIPLELSLGASALFGPRQYNITPTFGRPLPEGQDPPLRLLERRYLLVSADVILTGPADAAIGVQDFLAQQVQQSGRTASIGLRAGVESEFWEDLMQARAGAYFEPSRFDATPGRLHLTGGLDYHFTLYWEWKIGLTFDLARRYSNVGLGLGFWH